MKIFHFIILLLILSSCGEVTITVTDIPDNTPEGSRLYVMGNFNYWDPGDPSYQLKRNADSTLSISIPKGFGKLEFKISRGEWSSIETDNCGYHLQNRVIGEEQKKYSTSVLSWKDLEPINCGHITFKLKVPENTPQDEPLSLAGNFNLWNPQDSNSVFCIDSSSGEYLLTIPKPNNTELLSVKVTRGDLEKAEADLYGNESPVRNIAYSPGDTIELKVDSWEDLVKPENSNVTIVVENLPENTPPFADIFLVGNFNGWYPKDKNFIMKEYNGKYYYSLPRKSNRVEFKFTRGSWKSEQVTQKGQPIDNHVHVFGNEDTLRFDIEAWKDLYKTKKPKYITFEVISLPGNTPPEDEIYITGSFNGWNPGEFQYRLRPTTSGNLIVNIPRKSRTVEYKFTRGNWDKQEVDVYGRKIDNRYFRFEGEDHVKVRIENWQDLYKKNYKPVRVIIDELPPNTPKGADIYFASDLNDWDAKANRYRLKMNAEGQYYIDLPIYRGIAYFKFTRGAWASVETDELGYDISNRELDFSRQKEQHFVIKSWHDMASPK